MTQITPQIMPPSSDSSAKKIIWLNIFSSLFKSMSIRYKRRRCPKCGGWKCLQFHSEVIKDKTYGYSKNRYGTREDWYGRTSDDPFVREWVEERYICEKCGRHVSIEFSRDKH